MPTATLLIGISGSGKSTYAAQMVKDNPNMVHLERDKTRAFLKCLPVRQNKDVVVADTHLYPKHVARLVEDLTELGFQVRKIVISVTLEEALRRNESRTEGKVPVEVIEKQYAQFTKAYRQ